MKAYVITHSSPYEPRAEAVGMWLQEQGTDVTWIYADFDHRTLRNVVRRETDHVYLHMEPYTSNLSPGRVRSIQGFAKSVETYLTGKPADLLYFLIPANSFVPVAKRLKKRTGAKVVFDIIDLWPESLPLAHIDKLPPVYAWKQLRDRGLNCADVIFTECTLYQELLTLPREKTHTLYWFREEPEGGRGIEAAVSMETIPEKNADGCLHLAYIGAINNIIDTEAIANLLKLLQKERPVVVHVIGYGRRKEVFLKALDEAGVQSEDYGAVFDEKEKREILRGCAFGINMMVPGVRVGLTMKSLDYLAYGLPLLNNIAGDTARFVEEYDAGVNISREAPETVIPHILAMADDPLAGADARRLYEEHFTERQFRLTLENVLGPLLRTQNSCRGSEEITGESAGMSDAKSINKSARISAAKSTDESAGISAAKGINKSAGGSADENIGETGGPAVSVAMAACNGEKYLQEQLDSILPQLGTDDEIVVSVDPSQDRTFELLFEYAAKDPRVRVLEGPGAGVIRNVENALKSCRGNSIFLADQDDVWLPDKVEKVCKTLEHNTLVLHDARIVDAGLAEIAASFMHWRRSRKGVLANIRKNSYIGCCMAFRRELLDYVLPFPENLPMHDQWIGLMAEKYGSVRLLRMPLLLYRRHETNATRQTHAGPAQMLKWRAEIVKEVIRR